MVETSLLIIVPARSGSKRLPDKNMRLLAGRPLLSYTADAITAADLGASVLLTTDDPRIADLGRGFGWMVPFLRPPELAADTATMEACVIHALDWYAAHQGGDPAGVMVLQPTSPLRSGDDLKQAVRLLRENPDSDAVIGMQALRHGLANVFVEDMQGRIVAVRGRQSNPMAMVPNGAVFLARTTLLRHHGMLYLPRSLPLLMSDVASVDIDYEWDWLHAETLLQAARAQAQPRADRHGLIAPQADRPTG